mmetsp:Transcript_74018/g.205705  ORF Transcript_74018/g.205705 Transcript_74018/m.205705 type:complete len:238 (-) Transcript_74018:416-1129(-)
MHALCGDSTEDRWSVSKTHKAGIPIIAAGASSRMVFCLSHPSWTTSCDNRLHSAKKASHTCSRESRLGRSTNIEDERRGARSATFGMQLHSESKASWLDNSSIFRRMRNTSKKPEYIESVRNASRTQLRPAYAKPQKATKAQITGERTIPKINPQSQNNQNQGFKLPNHFKYSCKARQTSGINFNIAIKSTPMPPVSVPHGMSQAPTNTLRSGTSKTRPSHDSGMSRTRSQNSKAVV